VLVRTRGVGLNTAMMAAERGQETAQTEMPDSEEHSECCCMLAKQRRLS